VLQRGAPVDWSSGQFQAGVHHRQLPDSSHQQSNILGGCRYQRR